MGGDNLQCCYREQMMYALYSKFREPKLFRMAVEGDWDDIPARCRSHPKEAAFVHKYAPNDTALHRLLRPAGAIACSVQSQLDEATVAEIDAVKLAAVSALLEANRQAAAHPDSFGRTPLHLACMDFSNCGLTVALIIVTANPRAIATQDVEGRTPLHLLLSRQDEIPMELLQLMIEKCPQVVAMEDAVRQTPADIVVRRDKSIKDAKVILQALNSVFDKLDKVSSKRLMA